MILLADLVWVESLLYFKLRIIILPVWFLILLFRCNDVIRVLVMPTMGQRMSFKKIFSYAEASLVETKWFYFSPSRTLFDIFGQNKEGDKGVQ